MKKSRIASLLIYSYSILVILFSFQSVEAKMNSEIESSYSGGYRKSDIETVSQLMLLEDHTFCFLFMGGSLDLVAVGHWKLNTNPESGIVLNEVRSQTQVFPAYIEKTNSDETKVRFIFDGYSMSNARQAVFATSKTDKVPTQFRPLFEEEQTHWREEYELSPMDADEVKYFYLGYVEVDKFGNPEKLKVFQYKHEKGQQIRIGFNSIAVSPLMNMTAVLENKTLILDGENFGTKEELPPDVIKEIHHNFIDPVLLPGNATHGPDEVTNKANQISSIKEITLELKAISGNAFEFVPPDPVAYKYNDWSFLSEEYNNALENSDLIPEFFKVSVGLVQHQTVKKKNAENLVVYYNTLLNNNEKNVQKQFEIIETFIERIEPAVRPFRKEEAFNKNYEIFASNSLGSTIAHDNKALKSKIYKMLGGDVDLKKLKHGTLLYNLACDYARNQDKQKMLEAIRLAIEKGKNPENFAKDTDFKLYYSDPDFIKAISGK